MAVSSVFHVEGPFKVEIALQSSSPSWIELGQSDNDDLMTFDISTFLHRMESTSKGRELDDGVHLGREGKLTFTAAKWVETTRQVLMVGPGGSGDGHAGTIGQVLGDDGSSGTYYFGVRITPVDAAGDDAISAARPQITFTRCFFDEDDSIGWFDFGNQETRLRVQMTVRRNDSTNDLYAVATS